MRKSHHKCSNFLIVFATIDYLEASNYVIEHLLLPLHSITQDLKDCTASASELGNAYSLRFLPKLCYEKVSKTSKLGIYYSQVCERRAFFCKISDVIYHRLLSTLKHMVYSQCSYVFKSLQQLVKRKRYICRFLALFLLQV